MKLKNYTNISDARIRGIIQHVRANGISNFDVRISNCQKYVFKGCCYYNGAGCHDTANPFIIIRITKDEDAFPYFAKYTPQIRTRTRVNPKTLKSESVSYSTGTGGYIDHLLLSREEAIVHVCAHELRHLWQKEHKRGRVWGARGRFSDRDADAYAIRKTREWRRQQNNNTVGLGSWSGRLLTLENNYITWLTSSAVGSGILFAIISQSISKGKNESFTSKALRFVRRRTRDD